MAKAKKWADGVLAPYLPLWGDCCSTATTYKHTVMNWDQTQEEQGEHDTHGSMELTQNKIKIEVWQRKNAGGIEET